jgi:hypothetical protein
VIRTWTSLCAANATRWRTSTIPLLAPTISGKPRSDENGDARAASASLAAALTTTDEVGVGEGDLSHGVLEAGDRSEKLSSPSWLSARPSSSSRSSKARRFPRSVCLWESSLWARIQRRVTKKVAPPTPKRKPAPEAAPAGARLRVAHISHRLKKTMPTRM